MTASQVSIFSRDIHCPGTEAFIRAFWVERGAAIRETLEGYAALDADLIKVFAGDRFTPSVFLIKDWEGGR